DYKASDDKAGKVYVYEKEKKNWNVDSCITFYRQANLLSTNWFLKDLSAKKYINILNKRIFRIRSTNGDTILHDEKKQTALLNYLSFINDELVELDDPEYHHQQAVNHLKAAFVNETNDSSALLNDNYGNLINKINSIDINSIASNQDELLNAMQPYAEKIYITNLGKSEFRQLIVSIDFTIQAFYQKAFKTLHGNEKFRVPKYGNMAGDFQFPPSVIDYLFGLSLLFVFTLIELMKRYSWRVGIVTHTYVLRRLRMLNENIAAQITMDNQKGVSGGVMRQTFNIFTRRTRTYPIAGVREIENELIDILRDIDKIPSIWSRPEFIFIFDELDKIEAQYNVNIVEKEGGELSSFTNEEEGYFTIESIRKRQETIARILGNLKLFFNTARAKFIFIAGREMYDASLADISDRDSFISSIFHEIIYVESFFKDPGNQYPSGISGLTEEFVCQLLMPRFAKYDKNLKGYNEYLKDHFTLQENLLVGLMKWLNRKSTIRLFKIEYREKAETADQRRKVIYTLQQFITFLTYRGNGSPKKITKLLESFVTKVQKQHLYNVNSVAFVRNHKNLFLEFDETCQYRIGLTDYLFKPYLVSNVMHMREFADKTLVATAFLLDHLYKFHNTGFSWENLELTPEIIAINRSPRLRRFISQLLDFMSNNHIDEIINGLYQFKFYVKIASEITYVSTISESESAAFNFTLDESLLLKRHYRKKLKSLDARYRPHIESDHDIKHIQSLGFVNSIIGDLHFYDREYDDAILHYHDAAQYLLEKRKELPEMEDFHFLLKLLLKTGLTYEKMKDYDAAYITIGRLSRIVKDYSATLGRTNKKNSKNDKRNTKHDHHLNEENGYSNEFLHLGKNERKQIKRKVFENMSLIFQPIVAQFMLTEKGSPNGLTVSDLISVKSEFADVVKDLENDEKFLIESEFENKLGDSLYFKNGKLLQS
ncbi:MAG: hypothetical protein WBA74_27110, partial [Cyclobacteriaceae bacterium]